MRIVLPTSCEGIDVHGGNVSRLAVHILSLGRGSAILTGSYSALRPRFKREVTRDRPPDVEIVPEDPPHYICNRSRVVFAMLSIILSDPG